MEDTIAPTSVEPQLASPGMAGKLPHGAPIVPHTDVVPPPMFENPLLSRVQIPGEIFRLPSCGLFYNDGELGPDVKDGEVHIHPMTAIDEITIRSPDMIFSGDAVNDVIRNCVPQVLKPKRLLARDIDFLMAALKKVSYGNDMEVKYTHTCEDAKEHRYIIHMDKFLKESKFIDPSTVVGKFSVSLKNGQSLNFAPMRYDQVVEMMQATDTDLTPERRRDMLVNTLAQMILNVDEVTDTGMIADWLKILSVKDVADINKALDEVTNWGPDFTVEVVCKDCGETAVIAAPMNPISFFM